MAIPGRVVEVRNNKAIIDYGRLTKTAGTDIVRPKKGDWVLVFSDHVMEIIPEKRAKLILKSSGGGA
jgi:hydrogenase assembly chaperone HypC/HupF